MTGGMVGRWGTGGNGGGLPSRVVEWLWRSTSGPQRPVVVAGLTVRLAGIVTLGYVLPLIWRHLPHPGWSALLAAGLVAHAGLTAGWWLRRRGIGRRTPLVDLPVGVAAQLLGAALAIRHGPAGWTDFAFPYTVLAAFVLGLACRTWWAAGLCGLIWGGTQYLASTLVGHTPFAAGLFIVPSYLVGPVVGWTTARLLRRTATEVEAAQALAVRRAAELATEQERGRHAQALHDRLLQTLETLARGGTVDDPALAERIGAEAAWLRRFVESGTVDQREDLVSAIAAAARAAGRSGVAVELNDAALRCAAAPPALAGPVREVLLAVLHQTVLSLAGCDRGEPGAARPGGRVVVRVVPDRGGLLVTVLATGTAGPVDTDELEAAGALLRRAGGTLRLDPEPYAELWVPATSGTEVAERSDVEGSGR